MDTIREQVSAEEEAERCNNEQGIGPLEQLAGSDFHENTSQSSEVEPFSSYKLKIEKLLTSIGFEGYSIEQIQHGKSYMNCVYGLTPTSRPKSSNDDVNESRYILRVPTRRCFILDGEVCQAIVNDVALLEYLSKSLLPVPRVKASSAMTNNVLKAPYIIQTRMAGTSLKDVYADLPYDQKRDIMHQFVDVLSLLESIHFETAGTFEAPRLQESSDFVTAQKTLPPNVVSFIEGGEYFDLQALLSSHINNRNHKDLRDDQFTVEIFKLMSEMLDTLDQEGAFADKDYPIVLNHTDLEPRNIVVSNLNPEGRWKISGIVDWDDALAVPRPLARIAPAWIWDFDAKRPTGYLNADHHPISDENLSEDGKTLKNEFAVVAGKRLGEKYLKDAYGDARWLRLIWHFVLGGVHDKEGLPRMRKMKQDWAMRPRAKQLRSASSTTLAESSTTLAERALK